MISRDLYTLGDFRHIIKTNVYVLFILTSFGPFIIIWNYTNGVLILFYIFSGACVCVCVNEH